MCESDSWISFWIWDEPWWTPKCEKDISPSHLQNGVTSFSVDIWCHTLLLHSQFAFWNLAFRQAPPQRAQLWGANELKNMFPHGEGMFTTRLRYFELLKIGSCWQTHAGPWWPSTNSSCWNLQDDTTEPSSGSETGSDRPRLGRVTVGL